MKHNDELKVSKLPDDVEMYDADKTYITSVSILCEEDEGYDEIPKSEIVRTEARQLRERCQRDGANVEESRIAFDLRHENAIKCFILLKNENLGTRGGGVKITSIGYSSIPALKDMLMQIEFEYSCSSLDSRPSYLWFKLSKDLPADFESCGFRRVGADEYVKNTNL